MRAKDVEARNRAVAETIPQRLFEPDADEVEDLIAEPTRDLSKLTDREREVYRSVEYEGLSPAELADFADMPSASSIRTLLARSRKKLGETHD